MSDLNIKNNLTYNTTENINGTNKTNSTPEVEKLCIFSKEEDVNEIVESVIDGLLGDGIFTKEEAQIYVNGEEEIKELIEKEQKNKSFLKKIIDASDVEKRIREKYEEEHPEYANVKEEGDKVKKEYTEAFNEANKKWIEENPLPENTKIFSLDFLSWKLKQSTAMTNFTNQYAKDNPDYANLKAAEDNKKSLFELFFS